MQGDERCRCERVERMCRVLNYSHFFRGEDAVLIPTVKDMDYFGLPLFFMVHRSYGGR